MTTRSVELPEPEGSISPLASPCATRRLIALRICTRAAPVPSERLMFEMAMVSGSRPANDEGSMRLSMARSYGTSTGGGERARREFAPQLGLGVAFLSGTPPPPPPPAPPPHPTTHC